MGKNVSRQGVAPILKENGSPKGPQRAPKVAKKTTKNHTEVDFFLVCLLAMFL